MKAYDPAQVWERVQSSPASDSQSLQSLMDALLLEARIFQQLSRKLPPSQAALARELQHQFLQQLSCLKGMHILISGSAPNLRKLPIPADPPEVLLRQSYAHTLRLRTDYEARRSDPAYGHIFRVFSNELPQQSRRILELLGAQTK